MSQPSLPPAPTAVRRCLFSRCLKSLEGRRSNTKWCSAECRYQAAAYERHYWNCPVCDLQQKRIRGFAPWCPTCEPQEQPTVQQQMAQRAAVQRVELEQRRVKTMQEFTRDKHRWLAALLLDAGNKQGSTITYHGALKWQQLLSQLNSLEGRLVSAYQDMAEGLNKPLPRW